MLVTLPPLLWQLSAHEPHGRACTGSAGAPIGLTNARSNASSTQSNLRDQLHNVTLSARHATVFLCEAKLLFREGDGYHNGDGGDDQRFVGGEGVDAFAADHLFAAHAARDHSMRTSA